MTSRLFETGISPQGRMLPSDIEILPRRLTIALFIMVSVRYWKPVHGLDFPLEEKELGQARAQKGRPGIVYAAPQILTKTDLKSYLATTLVRIGDTLKERPLVTGFSLVSCAIESNVLLDTAPHLPETHWAQTVVGPNNGRSRRRNFIIRTSYPDNIVMYVST